MPISVAPLTLNYSFAANAAQATDLVDLAQLDAVLAAINAKVSELIFVLNAVQRDDNTLNDSAIDFRCLSDEVVEYLASQVNAAATPA